MPTGFKVIFERPDKPLPSPPQGEPTFRPRRYHTKSRNGCYTCKRRRIKCDEAQPACTHCWDKGTTCEYPRTRRSSRSASTSLSPPPPSVHSQDQRRSSSQTSEFSLAGVSDILDHDCVPSSMLVEQGYCRSDVLGLLEHFLTPSTTCWIGCPIMQELLQEHIERAAPQTPYLLYSVLAFSAAHRYHLNPEEAKYKAAALYHYQQSLEKYSGQLSGVLEEGEAESLLASCSLHAYLAFIYSPFSHIGRPSAENIEPDWVRSMQGATFIMQSPVLAAGLRRGKFAAFLDRTQFWRVEHYEDANPSQHHPTDMRQFLNLAQCHTSTIQHREILSVALDLLQDLVRSRPTPDAVGSFIAMINELPKGFTDLLQAAEPQALLIIAFWCALFSRTNLWWIVPSARAECHRLCEYVGSLQDPRYAEIVDYLQGACA